MKGGYMSKKWGLVMHLWWFLSIVGFWTFIGLVLTYGWHHWYWALILGLVVPGIICGMLVEPFEEWRENLKKRIPPC